MHKKNTIIAGVKLTQAQKAIIILHGRGGNANDSIILANHLHLDGFTIFAPEATNHSWYPRSFLAPISDNEPWLTAAISIIREIVDEINHLGINRNQIYFAGFSQGACLTLEFVARHASRWGGVVAFTGGLIGEQIDQINYNGDFEETPIFIASSDPDPHVPVQRVNDSVALLRTMNARVSEKIFMDMGHKIIQQEIDLANELIFEKYDR